MKSKTTVIWFVLAGSLAAFIWIFEHHFQAGAPAVPGLLSGFRAATVASLQTQINNILNGTTISGDLTVTGNIHTPGGVYGGGILITGGVTLGGLVFSPAQLAFLQSIEIAAASSVARAQS